MCFPCLLNTDKWMYIRSCKIIHCDRFMWHMDQGLNIHVLCVNDVANAFSARSVNVNSVMHALSPSCMCHEQDKELFDGLAMVAFF